MKTNAHGTSKINTGRSRGLVFLDPCYFCDGALVCCDVIDRLVRSSFYHLGQPARWNRYLNVIQEYREVVESGTDDADSAYISRSEVAMWFPVVSSWMRTLFYMWGLMVPVLPRDRYVYGNVSISLDTRSRLQLWS